MSTPFVAILMGSDSDLPVMQSTLDTLTQLQVPFEVKITSAHRTPDATHHYVSSADKRGCAVFIAAAGLAAEKMFPEIKAKIEAAQAERAGDLAQ